MSHKCFISFKKEDIYYKNKIIEKLGEEQIKGKALNEWIDSDDIDYVMRVIREKYMSNTSVTLFLIGQHSSEKEGNDEKGRDKNAFIKRELQATLYDWKGFNRSGLLGIVLPEMEQKVFWGKEFCNICKSEHSIVKINDDTVIKEFSANYYLRPNSSGCGKWYGEEDRFCIIVRYSDFMSNPDKYIDEAFEKLNQDINNYVHWRDLRN